MVGQLTPRQYELFGRFIEAFGAVEAQLVTGITILMRARLFDVIVATAGMGYLAKREALIALTRVSTLHDGGEHLRQLLGEIHSFSGLRNHIAHDAWAKSRRRDAIKPWAMRTRGGNIKLFGSEDAERDYTIQDLEEKLAGLRHQTGRLRAYLTLLEINPDLLPPPPSE